jgi:hypothetical protein
MRRSPARCGLLLLILAAWPLLAGADAPTTEYADPQYRFTFRFPADWERQTLPTPGEGGTVRLAARSTARPIFVLAIVTPIARAIPREDVERHPDRNALVEELIRLTIDQVYGKMSRDLSASRMVVDETHHRPFDAGLAFSIQTSHATSEGPTTVAGTHVIPFGEAYAITLLVVERGGGAAAGQIETRRRLLDSLRVHAR